MDKKVGIFKVGVRKILRTYDPELETPDEEPTIKNHKPLDLSEENSQPVDRNRKLTNQQRAGYLVQTGREFTTMGQVREHMKIRGQRFSEKGDSTDLVAKEISEKTEYDHKEAHKKARAQGIVPGLGSLTEQTMKKKLKRRDYDS